MLISYWVWLLRKCFTTYSIAFLNIFCPGNSIGGSLDVGSTSDIDSYLDNVVSNTINLDKRSNTYSVEIPQSVLTLGWIEWQALLLVGLFLLHFEQFSVETEGTLPVDHASTIKSVRAYKIIISFSF